MSKPEGYVAGAEDIYDEIKAEATAPAITAAEVKLFRSVGLSADQIREITGRRPRRARRTTER